MQLKPGLHVFGTIIGEVFVPVSPFKGNGHYSLIFAPATFCPG